MEEKGEGKEAIGRDVTKSYLFLSPSIFIRVLPFYTFSPDAAAAKASH